MGCKALGEAGEHDRRNSDGEAGGDGLMICVPSCLDCRSDIPNVWIFGFGRGAARAGLCGGTRLEGSCEGGRRVCASATVVVIRTALGCSHTGTQSSACEHEAGRL